MTTGGLDSVRIALHLVSVSVWVGGQIVLAGLVPVLRREAPSTLPKVARAFARLAWPAMFVIVVTGAWSLSEVDVTSRSSDWLVTLTVKLGLVGLAVAATVVHSWSTNKKMIALGGALSLLGSLAALYLGVVLSRVG